MFHPTDRIAYTTAYVVTLVVEHWFERDIDNLKNKTRVQAFLPKTH